MNSFISILYHKIAEKWVWFKRRSMICMIYDKYYENMKIWKISIMKIYVSIFTNSSYYKNYDWYTHNLYGIYGIFFINKKCFFLISKDFSISSILDIILSEDIIFYGIIILKKYKYIIIISILI